MILEFIMMGAITAAQSLCVCGHVPRSRLPLNDGKAKLLELHVN